jgi:3-oxoacyl-[acyl-carrier protein] reductase
VQFAASALNGVDILVCNCGGPPGGRPTHTSVAQYELAFRQILVSAVSMCSAVVPHMERQGWGRIVAISSHAVREPSANIAASSTARAALASYLKVLSSELAPTGITVNSVQPGAHDTARMEQLGLDVGEVISRTPVGKLGHPDDFGRIVAFLCSSSARFITGTSLLVDGGASRGLI